MSKKQATFVLILRASDFSSGNAPSHKYATTGVRQSFVSIVTVMVDPNSILSFSTHSIGIVRRALCSNVEPRLAKALAWVFELHRTYSMLHSSNWALRDCMTAKYHSIWGSFAVYYPSTWFTMSCESLWKEVLFFVIVMKAIFLHRLDALGSGCILRMYPWTKEVRGRW